MQNKFIPQNWHLLLRTLSSCWRDPDASDALSARYRGRQLGFISELAPISTVAAFSAVGLMCFVFRDLLHHPHVLTLALSVTILQLIGFGFWWRGKSLPKGARFRVPTIEMIVSLIGLSALLFSLLALQLFDITDMHGRLFLTAIVAAFIATGGWMFSIVPHAGLTWVWTMSGVTAVTLVWRYENTYSYLAFLLLFYVLIISAAILMMSRAFIRRLMVETEIERQRQLVGLLLKDFEEHASDWLWETDGRGHLVHVSMHLAQAMQMSPQQLQGKSLVEVLRSTLVQPSAQQLAKLDTLATCLQHEKPFRDVVVSVMADGNLQWWALTAKPLRDRECGERIAGWRGVGSDITAARLREEEMIRQATVDNLTGIANRHQFSERVAVYFNKHEAIDPCTMLLLDLDNFKAINDTMGHGVGDNLLRQVAKRLSVVTASHGLLARLGGDEFALIVPGQLSQNSLTTLCNSMQAAISEVFTLNEHVVEIHASIGVGFAPDHAGSAEELLQVSDMALYEAKAAGRRTMRQFEPEMALSVRRKRNLMSDMFEGLERGEFFVVYQPQIDLRSGKIVCFEALVRWRHPVRGLISPAEFIPVAEDCGFILMLGAWILRQACDDALTWPAHIRVSVNVSATQFARANVRQLVDQTLLDSGLDRNRLELELTESSLMQDTQVITDLLKTLRQSGVRIALDDFGTGFSSLSYLRHFPLDKLKIDQSFIRALDGSDPGKDSGVSIIQAIVHLADALGLETTAEGVEDRSQRDLLRFLGCTYVQGYLYAKPMDAKTTLAYIKNQSIQVKKQENSLSI